MPIPEFTKQGILPNDIYDCSLEEVENTFGRFQNTDCRINLTKKLKDYVNELRRFQFGVELIIDGSYVTKKDNPGDIDLILVLAENFDYSSEVKPFEYNLIVKGTNAEYMEATGTIREIDLDALKFYLRDRPNGESQIHCQVTEEMIDEAKTALGERVNISGEAERDKFGKIKILKVKTLEIISDKNVD